MTNIGTILIPITIMLSFGCPQVLVVTCICGMAGYGYMMNDINLIAPLAAVSVSFVTCGLCVIIERCRNPDFESPLLPK